jgi:hypothetical protein
MIYGNVSTWLMSAGRSEDHGSPFSQLEVWMSRIPSLVHCSLLPFRLLVRLSDEGEGEGEGEGPASSAVSFRFVLSMSSHYSESGSCSA